MHCFFLFMFTKMVESVWRLTSKLSEMGQEKNKDLCKLMNLMIQDKSFTDSLTLSN